MLHGIILMSLIIYCEDFVFYLIDSSSFLSVRNIILVASSSHIFLFVTGTIGIVDYTNYDDMKYAIKKLDDTEFRNAFGRAYIRVGFVACY